MISQWNREFEEGKQTLPADAWDRWLWHSNMNAPLTQHVMLNEMHLLGLLIARYRARYQPETMDICLGGFWPHIVHGAKNVRNLTLRQLRDSIEDIQMHLATYSADWENVTRALDALLGRFGEMNLHLQPPGVMDDLASTDPENKGKLSLPFIRRTTALMAVLYRHVHLASVAEECDEVEANTCIEHCHIEAGLDNFYKHAMHADLPPGARIIYKQDFSGMYNCITQVVYFHYPEYRRRTQLELEEVRHGLSLINCLSVALELQPDIPVCYEDDSLKPGWNWVLLAGGAVYLVSPGRDVYTGVCIWPLLSRYEREA